MADNEWESAPQGASSLQTQMLANDAYLQANHPNWPTGGTAQQLKQESNYNPNAVSPKGAQGMVQAMPETKAAVEQQIGRKLDFNNINDQLAFHRYLMNQNLDRSSGDPKGALSLYNSGRMTPDNPETTNYVNNFNKVLPNDSGWESAPKATPDAKQQAANAFLKTAQPNIQATGEAVTGMGENMANMATGGAAMIGAGSAKGAAAVFGQEFYQKV